MAVYKVLSLYPISLAVIHIFAGILTYVFFYNPVVLSCAEFIFCSLEFLKNNITVFII